MFLKIIKVKKKIPKNFFMETLEKNNYFNKI